MAANQVAYGFINLQSIFAERIENVQINVVETAIQQTLDEHNRQLAAITELLADPVEDYSERIELANAMRLQPLDESGRARPVRVGGHYDVAFPLISAGIAFGETFLAQQKLTVAEVNRRMVGATTGDARWMRDQILSALFTNVNWTFPDKAHGNLVIKPIANGDSDVYPILLGGDVGATDTHFLAFSDAIATAHDPFPTIYSELHEHPANAGEVVVLIPTANRAAVEGLASFVPIGDPNINNPVTATTLAGTLAQSVPGELFGYHTGRVWLSEWRHLPSDYIIAVTTDGPRPLGMRQEEEQSLRGLKLLGKRDDYPFFEKQWYRSAGFGARNRISAVVARVGNGSYAIPAVSGVSYAAPIA